MAVHMESCSVEMVCASVGGSEKLLNELRERLQEWLTLQPHLPQDISKEILDHFILGTKMSLEQAKHKLDMFYTMKRLVPEIFADRDPRGSGLTRLHTLIEISYLPKLTPEKYRVCLMRPCAKDYSQLNAFDCFKYSEMIEDILMIDSESQSLGIIYVFDHSMLNLGIVAKYTPTVLKKTEVALLQARARRIKGIHFINAASVTETLVALTKKVLTQKLAARMHTHSRGDYESFYQYFPKSMLPKDYGGEELSVTELAELWRQKVDMKRDWFLEQDKIVVDERLRPGPAIDGDSLFGFSGSFRKLDVD